MALVSAVPEAVRPCVLLIMWMVEQNTPNLAAGVSEAHQAGIRQACDSAPSLCFDIYRRTYDLHQSGQLLCCCFCCLFAVTAAFKLTHKPQNVTRAQTVHCLVRLIC